MAVIEINIDFRQYVSHLDLIKDLSQAFAAVPGDEVRISIDLTTYAKYLYSDFLLLVVSVVNHLRRSDIEVKGKVVKTNWNDDKFKYAMRVDFFNLIGAEVPEDFVRHDGSGKFTEISEFDQNSIYPLQDRINLILYENVEVDKEMLRMLYYCLNEIMDNVLIHSSLTNGWACAQFFPGMKEIRLIITDTGVGIHQSLVTNPKSQYKEVSEKEALELCIQRSVTNGEGLGFGLFATSEFIKENGGELIICSGNHFLQNIEKDYSVNQCPYWHGTIVYLKINTDIPVDYQRIMPPNHSLPDDYQEFIDKMLGLDNELW